MGNQGQYRVYEDVRLSWEVKCSYILQVIEFIFNLDTYCLGLAAFWTFGAHPHNLLSKAVFHNCDRSPICVPLPLCAASLPTVAFVSKCSSPRPGVSTPPVLEALLQRGFCSHSSMQSAQELHAGSLMLLRVAGLWWLSGSWCRP